MTELPNFHATIMMITTLVALYAFSRDNIPIETSSLAVLAFIVAFFELFPYQVGGHSLEAHTFFSGFGHEALIAVAGLMVCGQGLVVTGALSPLGRGIARLWRVAPKTSLLLTLIAGALGSAFVNNTPIVVLLIPILARVATRNGESAKPWLMPMNFSTLLGGASTTIGTSTNLLVVAVAIDLGMPAFSMFDFFIPAAIAGALGIGYLWLIAPKLLSGDGNVESPVPDREFIFQILIPTDSRSVGKTLGDLQSQADGSMNVVRLRRPDSESGSSGIAPLPDVVIEPGDKITCRGSSEEMQELETILRGEIVGTSNDDEFDDDIEIAQIVVMDNSNLVGQTIDDSNSMALHELTILAVHRAKSHIRMIPTGVGGVKIQAGDVLLAQGSTAEVEALKRDKALLVLDERQSLPSHSNGWLATLILAGAVLLAALNVMSIAVAAVCGACAMIITRCIDWKDVGNALSIPVIMIVVVSLALGSALTETGATEYAANAFLYLFSDMSTLFILSALMLIMAILTNIVSNNAAAVIGTPIAISLANQLGSPPETFVLAVLFGANLSFVTPMAYKTNILVMSAGDYSFGDFVKVGLPLSLLLWVTYILLLPLFFGI